MVVVFACPGYAVVYQGYVFKGRKLLLPLYVAANGPPVKLLGKPFLSAAAQHKVEKQLGVVLVWRAFYQGAAVGYGAGALGGVQKLYVVPFSYALQGCFFEGDS